MSLTSTRRRAKRDTTDGWPCGGLPLGHRVEVWLRGNIQLRGRLRLKDEVLFIEESAVNHLELVVENVPFTHAEMESCVRLD